MWLCAENVAGDSITPWSSSMFFPFEELASAAEAPHTITGTICASSVHCSSDSLTLPELSLSLLSKADFCDLQRTVPAKNVFFK